MAAVEGAAVTRLQGGLRIRIRGPMVIRTAVALMSLLIAQNAAADTITRFQHGHLTARATQVTRSGEACGAGADYQYRVVSHDVRFTMPSHNSDTSSRAF